MFATKGTRNHKNVMTLALLEFIRVKGKGGNKECSYYRRISLLNVVKKLYGQVLVEKVKSIKNKQIE